MSNTDQENMLARSAFKAIASRYVQYFHMNPSVTAFCQSMVMSSSVEQHVKFMDNTTFTMNYMTGGSKKPTNCRVCGFCAVKLTNKFDREMYINRQYANASTVIHEMLHFLTHPQFWTFVPSTISEAVTEYFTRKVVSKATDQKTFNITQREGRYDVHHNFLQMGRTGIKQAKTRPAKGYMKKAYFQGDQTAISFILENFQDLDTMLKEDDA